jgi:hypothetical protein
MPSAYPVLLFPTTDYTRVSDAEDLSEYQTMDTAQVIKRDDRICTCACLQSDIAYHVRQKVVSTCWCRRLAPDKAINPELMGSGRPTIMLTVSASLRASGKTSNRHDHLVF